MTRKELLVLAAASAVAVCPPPPDPANARLPAEDEDAFAHEWMREFYPWVIGVDFSKATKHAGDTITFYSQSRWPVEPLVVSVLAGVVRGDAFPRPENGIAVVAFDNGALTARCHKTDQVVCVAHSPYSQTQWEGLLSECDP